MRENRPVYKQYSLISYDNSLPERKTGVLSGSSQERKTQALPGFFRKKNNTVAFARTTQHDLSAEALLNLGKDDKLQGIKDIVMRGHPASLPNLRILKILLSDFSPSVRVASIDAIGMVASKEQKYDLLVAIEDKSWNVRAARIEALGTLGEKAPIGILIQALRDLDETVRETAIWVLYRLRKYAPLLDAFSDESELVRSAIIEAVGNLEAFIPMSELFSILRRGLADKSDLVRAAAVQVTGKLGPLVPKDLFMDAFQDESEFVRASAIKAIGKRGEYLPEDIWLQALKDSEIVSQQASHILGKVKDLRISTETLLKSLKDNQPNIRALACWVSGEQKEALATQSLIELLYSDKDTTVREAANWALSHIIGHHNQITDQFSPTTSYQYPSVENFSGVLLYSVGERKGFVAAESCWDHILLITFCFQREKEPLLKRIVENADASLQIHPIRQALGDTDDMIRAAASQVIENGMHRENVGLIMLAIDIVQEPYEGIACNIPTKLILCFLECDRVREDDQVLSQHTSVAFWQDTRKAFDKRARSLMKQLFPMLFQHPSASSIARLWHNVLPVTSSFAPSLQAETATNWHHRRHND